MIPDFDAIGNQKKALSGLVLHFGEAGTVTQPCEAAYLGLSKAEGFEVPKIRVYVSPTSLSKMKTVYKRLGLDVDVSPLLLTQSELDAKSFLSLMAVGTASTDRTPLYMKIILVCFRWVRVGLSLYNVTVDDFTGDRHRQLLIHQVQIQSR